MLVVKLGLIIWVTAEEKGSAHREGTWTSWAIVDCVLRVMKAPITKPSRRRYETACHAVLRWALLCCAEFCLQALKSPSRRRDCRWIQTTLYVWHKLMQRQNDCQVHQRLHYNRCFTPEDIQLEKKDLEACVLLNVLWKGLCLSLERCMGKMWRRLCENMCGWWSIAGAWRESAPQQNVVYQGEARVFQTTKQCSLFSSRARGNSWAAASVWPGFSELVLCVLTAFPDKDILVFCCALG